MSGFLKNLTIKQKMRFGFGVIWLVLAIITIQAAINLFVVRLNVTEVVDHKQPTAFVSNELIITLEKSMNALSVFMLTDDADALASYQRYYEQANTILNDLEARLVASGGEAVALNRQRLEQVKHNMQALPQKVEWIQRLQKNQSEKFPAFQYVSDNLAGVSSQIQQAISSMVQSELNDLQPSRRVILQDLLNLQANWSNVLNSVRGYLAFRSADMSQNAEMYLEATELLLEKLQALPVSRLTLEQEESLPQIADDFATYRQNYMTLKTIHEGEKWRMDIWMMEHEIKPLFEVLEADLTAVMESAVDEMVLLSEKVADSSLNNIILLLSLSVMGQLVGMLISSRVTRSVVEPVHQAVAAMQDMAQGEGDLTRRLPVNGKDELAMLSQYFNVFVGRIQAMLQQLSGTVHELEKASVQMLGVTLSTKRGSEHQLSAAAQLTESVSDMTVKAKSVEALSRKASNITEQAVGRVKQGSQVVSRATHTIQSLSIGMAQMTDAVNQLNEDSKSIGQVVSVIREIAEQTNLLALNAAIEAARAGEHGRGFAVVADEVRGLAQRTQESTLEIERIIEKICDATSRTVGVVSSAQQNSQDSCGAIELAQQELAPVVKLMDNISQMSEQIFGAAHSQATLAAAVNEHIGQIHLVSEQTALEAVNTEKAGNQMQALADRLDRLVHQFKV
ncbi:MAG: methyl-accepting chemotaxis protein [Thiomicrospira sp.]|jgi:methyl-accepting chemotaxis protein|nr:methyl-accepting chemotaxis protein [Thiomicrospira sp.]